MALSIYDYTDYRAYLKAWFEEKKARSVRGLAQRLEISPSQISMIRSGKRNLNLEHARHWGWGLRLDDNETDHWEAMVRMEHAPTEQFRRVAKRQLQAAQAWQNAVRRSQALEAYNNWYGVVINQMAVLPGFKPEGSWIGPRLNPPVDPEEVDRTLKVLLDAGILIQRSDGTFEHAHSDTTTDVNVSPEAGAAALTRAHKAWLNLGHEALKMPASVRFLSHVVLSLEQARLDEVVDVLRKVQIEAAEASKDHEADTVYEIGLAVLPRSVPIESGESD